MADALTYLPKDIARRLNHLWEVLTDDERRLLEENVEVRRYEKNDLIYREGESPDYLLYVLSGKVKIYCDGFGGRSQIVRVLRPSQYLGYRASMAHEPYVTTAAALERTAICRVPMTVINELLMRNNRLGMFFLTELASDLGLSDRRTVSLTQKHMRGRMAEALLYLIEIYGVRGTDRSLQIRMTREDLAALSNMTTSNAIRTISAFTQEGIVTIDGKNIIINDEEKLKQISSFG